MSYEQNLGRVKGDAGTTYIPRIQKKEDEKLYISYTSNDGTPIPPELEERELSSYVYKPEIDSDTKEISFSLIDASSLEKEDKKLKFGSIKGDPGYSTIGTRIVPEEPTYDSLPQDEQDLINHNKSLIYIIDNNEGYLDSGIFEYNPKNTDHPYKFVYLENHLSFKDYLTLPKACEHFHTKSEIYSQLGNIALQQNAILRILGDSNSIVIPDDE